MIISTNTYLSYRDTGLLDQLKMSTKYVPAYKLEEEYKKQAELMSDKKLVLRERVLSH
ncbi:MAG: DNA repair protein RadC [Crocinitomicaceae bacterium]|jgi:DNA repair protein RadC